jgi:hypothetical protein
VPSSSREEKDGANVSSWDGGDKPAQRRLDWHERADLASLGRMQSDPSTAATSAAVPTRPRALLSLVLGLMAGQFAHFFAVTQSKPRDFFAVRNAARAILEGVDPAVVAAGTFYPLPSILAGLPWALVRSPAAATFVFMAVGAAAFAWALMAHGYAPLIGFFAAGMRFAVEVAQWSPLFAGAYAITPLAVFFVVKPHVGLAMWIARPSWWGISGGVALVVAAFLMEPRWITAWRTALATGASLGLGSQYPYTAPILLPGGFVALLAVLRWRRPEARLLFGLACMPQSLLFYETVPLALIPRGWKESSLYLALSYLALWYFLAQRPWPDENVTKALTSGRTYTLLLFIPLTLMVLRRPNQGSLPPWIERRVIRLPAWLRGSGLPTQTAHEASANGL